MAEPPTDFNTFKALARRAGLRLTSAQENTLHGAYLYLASMIDRVRGCDQAPESEPAPNFAVAAEAQWPTS